jgi:hypothetical protein
MAELWNTDSGAAARGTMIPLEDEQGERFALRALLDVYEDRVDEARNGAWEIGPALDLRPERRTTRILRAALGLLMAPLVVAGYAGLAGLILPIVMLRSVFGGRGRRQRRVGVRARATESPLWGRSEPFLVTAWISRNAPQPT